jgi:hypothetical protein
VGAPGWKQSETPLCSGFTQVSGLDVWSDAGGVFVLVSGASLPADVLGVTVDDDAGAPLPAAADAGVAAAGNPNQRTAIWHDDGSGWSLRLDQGDLAGAFRLTGLPRSRLLINDATSPDAAVDPNLVMAGKCALGSASGAALDCLDVDPIQKVFGVDAQLAYAVMGGTRLLVFDGAQWHSSSAVIPYPVTSLWADGTDVVAVGRTGTVMWLEPGGWMLVDPGTLEHFTSVWASGRDDVWVGTTQGNLFHYDGLSWSLVGRLGGVTCGAVTPIRGIWGAGSTVYVYTDTELSRWNGSSLEPLGNWSCGTGAGPRITGLWGNAADEVFLTLADPNRAGTDPCGVAFAVWFDGNEFHRI